MDRSGTRPLLFLVFSAVLCYNSDTVGEFSINETIFRATAGGRLPTGSSCTAGTSCVWNSLNGSTCRKKGNVDETISGLCGSFPT